LHITHLVPPSAELKLPFLILPKIACARGLRHTFVRSMFRFIQIPRRNHVEPPPDFSPRSQSVPASIPGVRTFVVKLDPALPLSKTVAVN
jgi:hypothetical protein